MSLYEVFLRTKVNPSRNPISLFDVTNPKLPEEKMKKNEKKKNSIQLIDTKFWEAIVCFTMPAFSFRSVSKTGSTVNCARVRAKVGTV